MKDTMNKNKLTLPLKPGKYYKTRDGKKARVVNTGGQKGEDCEIIGVILRGGEWHAHQWYADGRCIDNDLVADWPESNPKQFSVDTWPVGAVIKLKLNPLPHFLIPREIKSAGVTFTHEGRLLTWEDLARAYLYAIPNGKPAGKLKWKPCHL